MTEYLLVFILAVFGAFYNRRMANNFRIFWLVLIGAYSILMIGLRYRVGMDTINYDNSYFIHDNLDNFIGGFSFETVRDPFYHLICAFAKTHHWEFWTVQMTMNFITTTCIYIFLFRSCKNPFIGIIVFTILQWLYFSTEIMRESAAVGIFLINYRNFQRKNYFKYYLYSFLSIGFHFSAIITWIIPWCNKLRLNLFFVISCCLILCTTPFISALNETLAIATVADRVDFYIDQAEILTLNWKIAELIKSAILPIFIIYICKKYNFECPFKGLILLQLLFCCGTFAIPIIFSRFVNYTGLFVTVAISNILTNTKIRNKLKCFIWSIIIISQAYYYYGMYCTWVPYVSIFNPIQIKERENKWFHQFGGR